MRINIYHEELTDRVELVKKEAEGRKFFGLRFYLKTHEDMVPSKHQDDDSNAVTLWSDDLDKLINLMFRGYGVTNGVALTSDRDAS